MNLYLDNGFIDSSLWYKDSAPFIVALGGRGTGKTYGVLRDATTGKYGKFVYIRRNDTQLQAAKLPELNPFKRVNADTGSDLMFASMGKFVAGIYHGKPVDGVIKPSGAPVGIGVSLSVFSNIRGVDGMDYQSLIFDEFVKESHERPIRNEGEAFLNMYETLNRNRELPPLSQAPLKCLLLANSNDLRSPILDALGIVDEIDKMIRKGQMYKNTRNGMLSIYLYHDSPVSKAKQSTALYTVSNSDDFRKMALENEFSMSNYEKVTSRPLREYTPLVSIGNVTVYEHARRNSEYYVIEGVKAEARYTLYPVDMMAFKLDYSFLFDALLDNRLFYSSAFVKIQFERVWGL